MNAAFQAFLILLLYFPGAIFITGYMGKISQKEDMPHFGVALSSRAGAALVIAIILHSVWIGVGSTVYNVAHKNNIKWVTWRPNPQLVLDLLISNGREPPDEQFFGETFKKVGQASTNQYSNAYEEPKITAISLLATNLQPMFWYFFSLYVLSWVIGASMHRVVRNYGLDRRYKILRFPNYMHYALSGEAMQFGGPPSPLPVVAMQALVEIEKKCYIYCGLVHRWHHNPADGQLDWVQLEFPSRVVLEEGGQKTEELPAGILFLKNSEIKNFLLRYYHVDFINSSQQDHAAIPNAVNAELADVVIEKNASVPDEPRKQP